jgi:uncharacterized protein (TIGR03067 family)
MQPTPPAPLPEGKGESASLRDTREDTTGAPPAEAERSEAPVSPLPEERGAGGGGKPKASPFRALAAVAGLALVGLGVWYFGFRGPTDDPGRWQGEWQVSVLTVGPDGQLAQLARPGVTIRVTGTEWQYRFGEKNAQRYTAVLRPEANPKEVDLTQLDRDGKPTAFVLRGIYELERNRARVATAPGAEPRPGAFENADGGTVWLLSRIE